MGGGKWNIRILKVLLCLGLDKFGARDILVMSVIGDETMTYTKLQLPKAIREASLSNAEFIISVYKVSPRKFMLAIQNNAKGVEIGETYDYCGTEMERVA